MSYQEVCRFVSNKGHPSFPEIIKDAKDVFETKVNDAKVNLVSKAAFYVQIAQCVLSLTLHSILVPVIPSEEIRKIISTRYTVSILLFSNFQFDAKAALYRLRIGSFIQYVRDEPGEEVYMLFYSY